MARHWPRALALLGCVALAGLVVWMLARRSDDDTSLVIEGPRLAAAPVQVERHALLPQRDPAREVAVPSTSGALWNEPDAGGSAHVPERLRRPEAPAAPPRMPPALAEVPAPLLALQAPLPALEEVPAPLPALDEVAPPAPDELSPAPPAADEHELTRDAGTTTVTAAKAVAPHPPPPQRGTNNAPIFD